MIDVGEPRWEARGIRGRRKFDPARVVEIAKVMARARERQAAQERREAGTRERHSER